MLSEQPLRLKCLSKVTRETYRFFLSFTSNGMLILTFALFKSVSCEGHKGRAEGCQIFEVQRARCRTIALTQDRSHVFRHFREASKSHPLMWSQRTSSQLRPHLRVTRRAEGHPPCQGGRCALHRQCRERQNRAEASRPCMATCMRTVSCQSLSRRYEDSASICRDDFHRASGPDSLRCGVSQAAPRNTETRCDLAPKARRLTGCRRHRPSMWHERGSRIR